MKKKIKEFDRIFNQFILDNGIPIEYIYSEYRSRGSSLYSNLFYYVPFQIDTYNFKTRIHISRDWVSKHGYVVSINVERSLFVNDLWNFFTLTYSVNEYLISKFGEYDYEIICGFDEGSVNEVLGSLFCLLMPFEKENFLSVIEKLLDCNSNGKRSIVLRIAKALHLHKDGKLHDKIFLSQLFSDLTADLLDYDPEVIDRWVKSYLKGVKLDKGKI